MKSLDQFIADWTGKGIDYDLPVPSLGRWILQ